MSVIEDGSGKGNVAKVGDQRRLHTHALSSSADSVATVEGDAFNVSSNLVTLTNDCESGLLYIKNNEEGPISVTTLFVNVSCSTGGTGSGIVRFYLNPTTGTLISNQTCAQVLNRNVGNNQTLAADAYRGIEGSTITNGDTIPIPNRTGSIPSEYVLSKGKSFALSYEPPSGNTNVQVQIGFLVIRNYKEYTID